MKRISRALSCVILMIVLSTNIIFASNIELIDNYPKDGSKGYSPIGLGIKLFFDKDIDLNTIETDGGKLFKLEDKNGKKIPVEVFFKKTDPKYLLVVANPKDKVEGLGSNMEYKIKVSGNLAGVDGSTLGKSKIIKFTTRDTKMDMNVNIGLMAVMFVGMLVFSSINMRRQIRKEQEEKGNFEVNPYKLAKETGKSVEEVMAEIEKKKQKLAKKEKDKGGQDKGEAETFREEVETTDRKKVKAPRPISAAGSTYKTGRKAKAEAEAKAEEERKQRGTTRPKNRGKNRKK